LRATANAAATLRPATACFRQTGVEWATSISACFLRLRRKLSAKSDEGSSRKSYRNWSSMLASSIIPCSSQAAYRAVENRSDAGLAHCSQPSNFTGSQPRAGLQRQELSLPVRQFSQ